MRTKMLILLALVLMVAATPVFAQTTGGGVSAGELKFVGAAVGMAIASGLCGLAQGKAVSSAAESVARNPGARAGIQTLLVLGLAFIESLAIFTLLIIFVK
jgi:F-type H+-transporting ATPase subunit c